MSTLDHTILGIDPGLRVMGWGVVRYVRSSSVVEYCASGSIETLPADDLSTRLAQIFLGIQQVVENHKPQLMAIEEVFMNKNSQSTMKLCHARAAAMLAASQLGIPVRELHNREIKQAIVGRGNAQKQQMQAMLQFLLPTAQETNEHAIDALCAALCAQHLEHSGRQLTDKVAKAGALGQ